MSNISRRAVYFFLCWAVLVGTTVGASLKIDRELLDDIADDSPLSRAAERPAWHYLFKVLHDHTEKELEQAKFADVGFVELSRQSSEYRGKLVAVRGTLLRCNFIPTSAEASPFDDEVVSEPVKPPKPTGFYESWILLGDEKRVPISVCSLEVPDGMPQGDEINEKIDVLGFFYKRQLYLSGNDEVTTPTILAKTLHWMPTPVAERKARPGEKPFWLQDKAFWQLVCVIIACWVVIRFLSRRWIVQRKPIQFEFHHDNDKKDEDRTPRSPVDFPKIDVDKK